MKIHTLLFSHVIYYIFLFNFKFYEVNVLTVNLHKVSGKKEASLT